MKSVPAIMIAATASNSGKTTVTLGIISALSKRGLGIQPFKVGPDYIDPGHLTAAAGRLSYNLDGWMIDREANLEIYHRALGGADLAVIEGVMGLFDGLDGMDESGSSAQMAEYLGIPVILVVDASAMARSAAAVVQGFNSFHRGLRLGGVVFNNVGGPSHERILRQAMAICPDTPCIGCLPRMGGIRIGDRHLGLLTAAETPWRSGLQRELAGVAERHIDLELVKRIASGARTPPPPTSPCLFAEAGSGEKVPVAVAVDTAFSFYYRVNLELLEHAGAEIIPFSPLGDSDLPRGARGLYIGGGYPEEFAPQLAENEAMRECIAAAVERGMPVFAECGGFMYLCRSVRLEDGREYPMVGAIPARTCMTGSLQSLGYVRVTTLRESPLGPVGITLRGHEYRWSRVEWADEVDHAYAVDNTLYATRDSRDGFASGDIIAGYQHLHFASQPEVASHLTAIFRKQKEVYR